MPDLIAIGQGLNAVKALTDIGKTMLGLRDSAKLLETTIEFNQHLLSVHLGSRLHGVARRAEQIELNRSSCAEVYARDLVPLRVHGATTELTLAGGDRRFESLPLQRGVRTNLLHHRIR